MLPNVRAFRSGPSRLKPGKAGGAVLVLELDWAGCGLTSRSGERERGRGYCMALARFRWGPLGGPPRKPAGVKQRSWRTPLKTDALGKFSGCPDLWAPPVRLKRAVGKTWLDKKWGSEGARIRGHPP